MRQCVNTFDLMRANSAVLCRIQVLLSYIYWQEQAVCWLQSQINRMLSLLKMKDKNEIKWIIEQNNPDSKVHGANMRPTWVLSAPDGPHVGPMNLAIRATRNRIYDISKVLLFVFCLGMLNIFLWIVMTILISNWRNLAIIILPRCQWNNSEEDEHAHP